MDKNADTTRRKLSQRNAAGLLIHLGNGNGRKKRINRRQNERQITQVTRMPAIGFVCKAFKRFVAQCLDHRHILFFRSNSDLADNNIVNSMWCCSNNRICIDSFAFAKYIKEYNLQLFMAFRFCYVCKENPRININYIRKSVMVENMHNSNLYDR